MAQSKKQVNNIIILIIIIIIIAILLFLLFGSDIVSAIKDKKDSRKDLPVIPPDGISNQGWIYLQDNSNYIETYRGIDIYEGFRSPQHKLVGIKEVWFLYEMNGRTIIIIGLEFNITLSNVKSEIDELLG